jgi:cysteine desulfurase / selenocysteine lyase
MVGLVALGAALDLFDRIGHDRVERTILRNAAYLARRLDDIGVQPFGRDRGEPPGSGIVTSRLPDVNRVLESLQAHGITASVRNGLLRLSPSFYHLESELDRALEVVQSINSIRS